VLRIWTAGLLVAAALATPAWSQSNRSSAPPKPPFRSLSCRRKHAASAPSTYSGDVCPRLLPGTASRPPNSRRSCGATATPGSTARDACSIRRTSMRRCSRTVPRRRRRSRLRAASRRSTRPSCCTAAGFEAHDLSQFQGATLTNTAWNSSSQTTITALPFDIDGVPYSFSTAELERIQYIWQRVAEDYAPFDVDVTTEARLQIDSPAVAVATTRSHHGAHHQAHFLQLQLRRRRVPRSVR